jgi:4-amino-4-deoxy-L-arabinose transferase-like glycosyltransferase
MDRPSLSIFIVALISGVILAFVIPFIDPWGNECARLAASLASGHGFSSPWELKTGASAWIPPAYPFFLAGIFRLFGIFSLTSYWVATAVNIVVHAFTCVVLYWAAGESLGRRTGWYAAMALATFPLLSHPLVLTHLIGDYLKHGLFIPPNFIWYTHFSELAIVLLIWMTLRKSNWLIYGFVWGIAALLNPSIIAMAPAFFLWRIWKGDRWRNLILATATAAVLVTPWLIRNYEVFHMPVFIRDNFGVELRVGNQLGGEGKFNDAIHPNRSAAAIALVNQMGEAQYSQAEGKVAMDQIRAHPGEFAVNVLRRIGYWWFGNPLSSHRLHALSIVKYMPQTIFSLITLIGTGIALKRKNQKALLFIAVLLFYPLVYYVTHTFNGFVYEYPIQPEMLVLAAATFQFQSDPAAASPQE